MHTKAHQKKSCLVIAVLIFASSFYVLAWGQEQLSVEDLLYKGRLELTDNNPTAALEYFKKALGKCRAGTPQYNGRYGRCNFFVGEAYFQRFILKKNFSDAKAAVKYFETVIDFGKKTTQDYPTLAKGRIRQIERALGTIETGVPPETNRTFKVKTIPKGKIVANSWNLYVNGERIDNPFVELFFIEDQSNDTPEALRKAVYISDAGAAEVAQRLGIQRITQKEYTYDRYGVLNLSRTFRKSGYTDIVLKNGERFNGQWAIIEYDLNMPALPIKLFEHFGATVKADWVKRGVIINAKTGSPAPVDWFKLLKALRLPSSGSGGDWIIGFHDFQLPDKIYPGQMVNGRIDLRIKENARGSSGAVIYISLFGNWFPGTELASIYRGKVGAPRLISVPFNFTAPSKPGTYHLRCPMVLAFSPVKNYYGSKPSGQNDPGIGPYAEVDFEVGNYDATLLKQRLLKQPSGSAHSVGGIAEWRNDPDISNAEKIADEMISLENQLSRLPKGSPEAVRILARMDEIDVQIRNCAEAALARDSKNLIAHYWLGQTLCRELITNKHKNSAAIRIVCERTTRHATELIGYDGDEEYRMETPLKFWGHSIRVHAYRLGYEKNVFTISELRAQYDTYERDIDAWIRAGKPLRHSDRLKETIRNWRLHYGI